MYFLLPLEVGGDRELDTEERASDRLNVSRKLDYKGAADRSEFFLKLGAERRKAHVSGTDARDGEPIVQL